MVTDKSQEPGILFVKALVVLVVYVSIGYWISVSYAQPQVPFMVFLLARVGVYFTIVLPAMFVAIVAGHFIPRYQGLTVQDLIGRALRVSAFFLLLFVFFEWYGAYRYADIY